MKALLALTKKGVVTRDEGEKLIQAKKGAGDFAAEAIEKGYSVGLIKFFTNAVHLCDAVGDVSTLYRHIEGIETEGSTDMAAGINIAISNLENKKGSRVMVIVTDGMPDNEDKAIANANYAKKLGIDIMTIGTDNAKKDFLQAIASRTSLGSSLGFKVSRRCFGEEIRISAKKLPLLLTA